MKVFITVLILIFSLQSWTKAEDISELEIEGISIGDSLLKIMNKSEAILQILDSYGLLENMTVEKQESLVVDLIKVIKLEG